VKVAAIQHDIVWEDPGANFVRLAGLISEAAAQGARLAVLTEMYSTGFSMAAERIAEPAGGRSSAFLVEQAARNDLWAWPAARGRDRRDTPSNCLVLAGPDGTILRYRKIHPFSSRRAPPLRGRRQARHRDGRRRRLTSSSATTSGSATSSGPSRPTPTATSWSRIGRRRGAHTG
jgi:predicted amidohydrolase